VNRKLDFKFWTGIAVSLFFLFLLFRKIDFAKLWSVLMTAEVIFLDQFAGATC
jgi:glycosyltransferase 2 family protein